MADLFRKGKSLYSSTTNSFGTGTGETITPSSVAGLPTSTEIVLTFDRTVTGKLERIRGHISGGNFVIDERGVDSTSDTSHTSPTVEYIPNAEDMNDLVDGLLVSHDQTGALKTNVSITTNAAILTSPKVITSINDTNNNELFKVTATGSAVNELTIANAATGNSPTISATGSDTDIDINLTPKGAGDINIPTGVNIQVNNADPKRGIYVPAQGMFSATTSGAASGQIETSTNKVNVKVFDFDKDADESVHFAIPSPLYWDAGTVTATPYWTSTAGTSGTVAWAVQGMSFANDDALDQAYGTAQTSTDTFITANDVHIGPATSAITIGGTPTAGDWIQFKIYRDVSEDTLDGDARLLGIRITFGIAKYDDQ